MKTLVAVIALLISSYASADGFAISGYGKNGGASIAYSNGGYGHVHRPYYGHGYGTAYYGRGYAYYPAMPPAVIYAAPQVVYTQPPVYIQQAPQPQYRGGTFYAPANQTYGCAYPREYDRVCSNDGSSCVICN